MPLRYNKQVALALTFSFVGSVLVFSAFNRFVPQTNSNVVKDDTVIQDDQTGKQKSKEVDRFVPETKLNVAKDDTAIKYDVTAKHKCKEVDRDWISVMETNVKLPSLLLSKDNIIYQKYREKWSNFVGGKEAKCVTKLNPSTPGGRFFQQLFDLFASHAAYCPFKVRLGGTADGGKWLCDIVPCDKCLIYSLGSGEHFEFEKGVTEYYGCDIHTFDCTTKGAKTPANVHFHPWCIGSKDETKSGKQFYTLTTIMKKLNHTYLDVLKMDIERYEYMVVETLESLSKELLPKQITFEVHLNPMNGFKDFVSFDEFETFWNRLHGMGYKAISHEINPVDQCCSDYTVLRS